MKLIIDIPEKTIAHIRSNYGHGYKGIYDEDRDKIIDAIYHGIPLDDVKAEIQTKEMVETDIEKQFYNMALGDVIKILDNIGKAESEK